MNPKLKKTFKITGITLASLIGLVLLAVALVCWTVFTPSRLTKTARKAIDDFYLCYEEEKQYYKEQGNEVPELEFEFIFDIGAFFSHYLINVSGFAEYAGMNASLLRQYACGLKSPTGKTIGKIREAIDKYKKDIDAGLLIDRPVPQYI